VPEGPKITIRPARAADGLAVWRMVHAAGTLDTNSAYAYLLFCGRFGDTCALAEDDAPVGFVTAFHPPRTPDTLFVWQVATLPEARGKRVASRMLDDLLVRTGARCLETHIAPDNGASDRLFRSFAERHGARVDVTEGYPETHFPPAGEHGAPAHAAEHLYRIAPLKDHPR